MSAHLQIRRIETTDLPAASELLAQLNPDVPPDTILARLATILADHPHYDCIGAFLGERLAGVAGAWTATKIWCGKYLEIDNLVVAPDARSQGIGAALIGHLEALARDRGCTVLTLDSYSGNHASHRLYHRLGFEIWAFHFVKPIGDWKGIAEDS